MEANTPLIIIRGIDEVIKRDLDKHRALLERSHTERGAYKQAVAHLIKRKKYYSSLIGGEKYEDAALQKSIDGLVVDLRHMSDKVKLSDEAMSHHQLIVDTLSKQLNDYNEAVEQASAFAN